MDPTPAPRLSWARLLPVRPAPALPAQARSVFLWGDHRVPTVALHTAARVLATDTQMVIIGFVKLLTLLPTLCHTHLSDAPFVIDGTPG